MDHIDYTLYHVARAREAYHAACDAWERDGTAESKAIMHRTFEAWMLWEDCLHRAHDEPSRWDMDSE